MLSIFSRKKRPLHLGKYPMEKIKRVEKTTTLITDNVKSVPKRGGFFVRAFYGDLGPKAGKEIRRFITKSPHNAAIGHLHWKQVPMHKGEPAEEKAEVPGSEEMAKHIKAMAYFHDADLVGICEMPEWAWFSHESDGTPITERHKYAIVIAADQGWETMAASTGDDFASGALSYRAYLNGSTAACIIADYIRRLGYPAQAHSNAHGDVQQVPLMVLAGLGELSRIGEMVLNPFIGPRHKTAVVTTDLPLAIDKPIDFGLQDFCDKCRKCARECPAQAIPYGDKVLYNGYEIWKPDIEKCTKYRVTNLKGSACGRCMKVCPWNKEGLMQHRAAMWAAIKWPWSRRFLIWLDDKMGYGGQNISNKWWYDFEKNKDGKIARAAAENEKELELERKPAEGNEKIAMYPPEKLPRFDEKNPVPVDRKQGLKDTVLAEEALREVKRSEAGKAGS